MYSMEICVSAVSIIVGDSLYGYRTVLSPWVCFFDGRTVFAPTILLPWVLCFSRVLYSIFKLRSGCDIWYYVPGFAYTEYHNARPRPDTSTLLPVPESLIVFTKSQGLYVPASIKTLSTYPENGAICCIKNATIAEMLPN